MPPESQTSTASTTSHPISENIAGLARATQVRVRKRLGLELTEAQVIETHLRALDPASLANAIVYSVTGNPADLEEDGDDEHEPQATV